MSENEKRQLVEYGNKLLDEHYTLGTGGNISIYNRELDLMAITPSGISFKDCTVDDIIVMKLDGTIVEGKWKQSSEWVMHKIFYERRTDINAVIHAHTIYSTVLATLRWDLPASHYMLAVAGKDVKCADYASYGTPELAENAYQAMADRKAVLLANHGVLTGEQDLAGAFNVLEEVEYCSNIHIKAKSIGEPVIIEDEEMDRMAERFKTYGQSQEIK